MDKEPRKPGRLKGLARLSEAEAFAKFGEDLALDALRPFARIGAAMKKEDGWKEDDDVLLGNETDFFASVKVGDLWRAASVFSDMEENP